MVFLPNGYDENDFAGKQATMPEQLVITYTGTIAANYPVDGLLQALTRIVRQMPFTLRFVGKVDEKTQALFRQFAERSAHDGWQGNVTFIPFVPHHVSIDYLLSSSVLLLINADVAGAQLLLHGKIFEYLASGKPILLLGSPDGKAGKVIRESHAGDAFDYHDVQGIENFLLAQYQQAHVSDMAYIRQFSRRKLTEKLAEIITRCI
jgi:glycosyltransferase involved in cell wall biosynthesis